MSVKTSVSSSSQSLSTRLGTLSGPGALHELILLRDLLTLSGDSVITWSPGGGGVQWCCFVPQREQRPHSARSAGIWFCHRWRLVVRNGLYPLTQALRVCLPSLKRWAIPPGVLSLSLADDTGQVGPSSLGDHQCTW